MSRKWIALAGGFALISALGTAHAQDKPGGSDVAYPTKPVTLVVPFAPGGSTDVLARLAAQFLSVDLGQSFIVENVSGAGGIIGAARVAKAQPDGYTLLVGSPGSIAINPHIQPNVPYNPVRDFEPVALIGATPAAVFVENSSPITSLQQLIVQAKAKPGQLTYGSAGVGSFFHLTGELFNESAGVNIRHVPYRGMAPAMVDFLAGRTDVMFADVQSYLAARGKVRALAVGSPRRSSLAPEVPTADELGLTGFHTGSWTGVLAPARTPAAIVNRLNAAMRKGIQQPAIVQRFKDLGMESQLLTPEAFGKFLATEIAETGKLVQKARIKPE
jgi:tripartite-type tricarboxylate transporter receptor subunit TctC